MLGANVGIRRRRVELAEDVLRQLETRTLLRLVGPAQQLRQQAGGVGRRRRMVVEYVSRVEAASRPRQPRLLVVAFVRVIQVDVFGIRQDHLHTHRKGVHT